MRMTTGVYDIANVGFTGVSVVTNPCRRRPTAAPAGPRRPPPSSGWSTSSPPRSAWTRPRCAGATSCRRSPSRTRPAIGTDLRRRRLRRRRSTARSTRPATTSCGPSRRGGERPATRSPLGIGLAVYVEITAGVQRRRVRRRRAAARRRLRRAQRVDAPRPGPRHGVGDDRRRPHRHADRAHRRSSTATPTWCRSGGLTVGSRSVQLAGAAVADATGQARRRWPASGPPTCSRRPSPTSCSTPTPGRFHVAGTPARGRRLGRPRRRRRRRRWSPSHDFTAADADVPVRRPRRRRRGRHRDRPGPAAPPRRRRRRRHASSTRCSPRARSTAASPRASPRRCSRRSRYDDDGNPLHVRTSPTTP